MNASDVATWIEALATLAAAGFAFTAWRQAKSLHRIEAERDRERHVSEERAAADAVAAWAVWDNSRKVWGARVVNKGSVPVYGVHVIFRHHDTGAVMADLRRHLVPPTAEGVMLEWPREAYANAIGLEDRGVQDTPVELTFSDTTGRRWRRDSVSGSLTLVG
jgi:hypothetical protein